MTGQNSQKKLMPSKVDKNATTNISMTKILMIMKESCWYWGSTLTSEQARKKLKKAPIGTFLLRDSASDRYLFVLTAKTDSGVTSLRLNYSQGRFQFEANDSFSATQLPAFNCAIQLVDYYYTDTGNRKICCCKRSKTEKKSKKTMKIELKQPCYNQVPSLQHLCRRTINSFVPPENLGKVPLTGPLVNYLTSYPYNC